MRERSSGIYQSENLIINENAIRARESRTILASNEMYAGLDLNVNRIVNGGQCGSRPHSSVQKPFARARQPILSLDLFACLFYIGSIVSGRTMGVSHDPNRQKDNMAEFTSGNEEITHWYL